MTIRYRRVVVPGAPVNRLATVREEVAREAPPPPLPVRATWTPPPAPTRHERILAVVTPRRAHAGGRPRLESHVTGAQLRRARQLEGVKQRPLAMHCACSRSAIAEAERGRRPVLPTVGAWVERTLRAHGEWTEPEGGNYADDADEGAAEADGGAD